MFRAILSLAIAAFVAMPMAKATDEKKPTKEVVVEKTHPDRDHQVEADDVNVKREKTTYASRSTPNNFNFRFGPLGLLFGYLNADFDFRISDKFTIGPSLSYFDWNGVITDWRYTGTGIGARGNIYPMGGALAESAFYIGPSVQFWSFKLEKTTSPKGSATLSAVSADVIFGYQWMWDSFNINLGGGPRYYSSPGKVKVRLENSTEEEKSAGSISGVTLALEFTLGFAF